MSCRFVSSARKHYRAFVEEGIVIGKRPELARGGLIRSAGGWKALTSLRKLRIHLKGDERMLGDSDFVSSVLNKQNEHLERRYRLQAQGFDLAKVVERVAKIFEMKAEEILSPGKQPQRVMVRRRRICYWGVKELGMKGTAVGKLLGMVQSSVSRAVARGERLALDRQLSLVE
ncbi:MAG: hypothetical protein Q8O60_01175 [Deltaproteobacteria bacterium]|nr:hypothetical protein [Deltaproteobacteria bacterium]MDP3028067.1 hypothetical protein [Deltaproteobacteria bacterium]